MKKLLSILLISFILFGCSEKRILLDELTNKGTGESPIMYNEDGLFNGICFDVFTNGQLRHEGRLVDGKLNGLYKSYYEGGQLKEEGNWKENVLNGLWKYYYENGQLKCEGSLEDGRLNGLWKYYYEDGQLSEEGNYRIYNQLEGICNFNLSHNIIFLSSNDLEWKNWQWLQHALKVSVQLGYETDMGTEFTYEMYQERISKKPKREIKLVLEKVICFLHQTINPHLNMKQNIYKYALWKYYYGNGQLREEISYRDNEKNDLYKSYYENGQLKEEGNWKGSHRDGLWKYYHEDGYLEKEWYWKDGKSGLCKYYYENGQLKEEGNINEAEFGFPGSYPRDSDFPRDYKDGWWKFYYPDGQLKEEGEFYFMDNLLDVPEKKRGIWKSYYQNGQLKEEIPHSDYVNDINWQKELRHGSYKSYYENGQLKEEGDYGGNYRKNGLWTFYYSNGQIKEEGNYDCYNRYDSDYKEQKHGIWKYYYENGELEDERNYRYGNIVIID